VSATGEIALPCPVCGYDLRGVGSARCPECGNDFEPERLLEASIPWQNRSGQSGFRTFWRTVRLALRQPGELARQASRPVDYRQVRRFQLWCVVLGWLGLVVWATLPFLGVRASISSSPFWAIAIGDVVVLAAIAVGVFLWLLLATGVPSYFFHPKSLDPTLQE
jgi:hypothetical protein